MLTPGEINAINAKVAAVRAVAARVEADVGEIPLWTRFKGFLGVGDAAAKEINEATFALWVGATAMEQARDRAFESPEFEHEEALRIVELGQNLIASGPRLTKEGLQAVANDKAPNVGDLVKQLMAILRWVGIAAIIGAALLVWVQINKTLALTRRAT